MPITINVGFSKKVGTANSDRSVPRATSVSRRGTICWKAIWPLSTRRSRTPSSPCRQAVEDELARQPGSGG